MPRALEGCTGEEGGRSARRPPGEGTSYCLGKLDEENRQLLATLGHELRNPLGTLRSVLEVLAEEPQDPEVRRRLYCVLERQVHHLDRLVQDLIESSRSPSHALAMHWEPLDLVELVVDVLEAQRTSIVQAGRCLELKTCDEAVWVRADAVRLSQIVRNLLSNAHRFTGDGGNIRVSIDVTGGGEARLRVTDDGVGLDPKRVEVIFEPFERGDRPAAGASGDGGLGLGLTIVRRLAEAHGGRVRARSDGHGHGTEVEVLLPRYHPSLASS